MAEACLFLLDHYDGAEQVNVGTGKDTTMEEIAETIAEGGRFLRAQLTGSPRKPDGTLQKLLDVTILREAGWGDRSGSAKGSSPQCGGTGTTPTGSARRADRQLHLREAAAGAARRRPLFMLRTAQ